MRTIFGRIEMMSKIGKKWIWILGGAVLLVGILAVFQGRDGDAAAAAPTGETAVAFVGDLAESVSASGQVVAKNKRLWKNWLNRLGLRLLISKFAKVTMPFFPLTEPIT